MKILHLEDSIVHQENVRELLAQQQPDWELTQVSRMKEAEATYKPGHFDVVICDPRLEHDDDGLEFAVKLHRAGQLAIITSAYSDNERAGIPFVPKQDIRTKLIPAIVAATTPDEEAVTLPATV